MMELNKVYKFTYHYNCCCHIVIKEKIHVNIKTNNKICVTLYDLVSQFQCPVTAMSEDEIFKYKAKCILTRFFSQPIFYELNNHQSISPLLPLQADTKKRADA